MIEHPFPVCVSNTRTLLRIAVFYGAVYRSLSTRFCRCRSMLNTALLTPCCRRRCQVLFSTGVIVLSALSRSPPKNGIARQWGRPLRITAD